jgi:hypothetical protein
MLRETSDYLNETIGLYKIMLNLQKKHNLKIDNLVLDKHDFFDLLTSEEINPVREVLSEKIAFFSPQAFWREIKNISERNKIRTITSDTKPLNISGSDFLFNLDRFGYREFGDRFAQGKKYCIEYIITKILLEDDLRKMDAIAVILAKNDFKSNLLAFLSQKYQTTARLLGILKILQQIKAKPEIENTIHILQVFNQEELPVDAASIKQKLELYNAL